MIRPSIIITTYFVIQFPSPTTCFVFLFHMWIQIVIKYDANDRWFHMVAMNKANIPLISNYCRKEGILIMPLRSHITKEYLGYLEYSTDYKSVFDDIVKEKTT